MWTESRRRLGEFDPRDPSSSSSAHLTLLGSDSGHLARGGMLTLARRTLRSTISSGRSSTRRSRSPEVAERHARR